MSPVASRIALAVSALFLLSVGVATGAWWAQRQAAEAAPQASVRAKPDPGEPLYWYDPMVPDRHFDKPGKSPFMDMQLVPKYAEEGDTGGLRIDATTRQNLGLRTTRVTTGRLQMQVRAPGVIGWDLRREHVVSARVDSIVSRLHARAPYEPVRRGQPLATVLAPAWTSALAEARALDQARSPAARELRDAARRRLRVLGVPDAGVGADGGVVLRSPADGLVSEVLVREGQLVLAGMPMFRINGTDTVWLEASIPQASAEGIVAGTEVTATVSAVPGRNFFGRVEALLPQVDAASRTRRARVVLRNDDGLLAPGMFAELGIQSASRPELPLIPTEALIATGSDSRVIVVAADGSFAPTRVRVGRSAGGRTEILEGLKGGERIVSSGQFLIDSEASLSGALDRLRPAEQEPAGQSRGEQPPAEQPPPAEQQHDHGDGP